MTALALKWMCEKGVFRTKPLIEYMRMVPDPRCKRKKKHDMAEVLTCLVAGYVTGHTTLRRCLAWCVRHQKRLKKMGLELRNGVASIATVSRVLSGLDEELFLFAFMEWVGEILDTKGLHLAIDGKAIRAAASRVRGTKAPMLLNAVDTATGLVVAQLPIQNKECEITQIPELLKLLDIRGSIITTDAIGTQTSIMEQIRMQGGHFLLMVKKNQPSGYEEIVRQFGELEKDRERMRRENAYRSQYPELMETYDEAASFEKNRDRYEYRKYQSCSHPDIVSRTRKEWPFLKSVGCVRQTRILMIRDANGADITPDEERFRKKGTFRQPKPETGDHEWADIQTVGLISDMEMTAEDMGRCRRAHWAVENRLHHVLDDTFREDRSPAKGSKNNLALIRKFACNILRLAMLHLSTERPMTEMMDLFSDDGELLERYVFNGIESLY